MKREFAGCDGGGKPTYDPAFLNGPQTEGVGDELKPDLNTPLSEFKTSKGIGIGSTIGEVKTAYPAAKTQFVFSNSTK